MNATLSAGTPYFVETADGKDLEFGGYIANDTEVEAVNVVGKFFHIYNLNGKLLFVKPEDDR